MSQDCVRCVVKLTLRELMWEEGPGSPLHLTGPPVFLRACVLGQLQHTPLHRPLFPLHLHHTLTFDRVFTNCTDQSLLKEVVTGEHVEIEMIQVSEDYKGGKVLARYETPAESFLFPESPGPARPREVKTVVLSKSRVYKHSPHLTLTTSTTLTKVTTPFGTPIPPRPPVGGPGEFSKPSNTAKHDLKSTAHKTGREETAQDKLHLLLSSYTTEPHPLQDQESGEGGLERELKLKRPHGRIKLKPPVPKFTSTKRSLSNQQGAKFSTGNPTQNHRVRGRGPLSSTTTDLYHCCTAFLGPHCWTACPRRSFRKHSAGQQPRPRSKSVPSPKLRGKYIQQRRLRYALDHHHASLDDLNVAPLASSGKGVVNLCRPFVAGKADVSVLARRNFCGQNPKIVQRHFIAESPSGGGRAQTREEGRECGFQGALFGVRERESPAEREETRFAVPHTQRGAAHSSPLQSRARRETGESLVDPALSQRYHAGTDDKLEGDEDSCTTASVSEEGTGGMGSQKGGGSSDGSQKGGGSSDGSSLDTLASGETSDASRESHSPQARQNSQPSVTSRRLVSGRHRELLSKYVQYEYGNGGTGTGTPARLIENKLNTLINECCECRRSADSLGRDDMTEDNTRLRASLSAERGETMNRSAQLLPAQSVLVGLGVGTEGGDYWSQRVAEFQGKPHRLVFDETLEKIYRRLYQNATNL